MKNLLQAKKRLVESKIELLRLNINNQDFITLVKFYNYRIRQINLILRKKPTPKNFASYLQKVENGP